MSNGADLNAESFAKEKPADLTTSPAILNLLGSPKMKNDCKDETECLPIVPHYLSSPSTGYKVDLHDQPQKSVKLSNGDENVPTKGKFYLKTISLSHLLSPKIWMNF